MLVSFILVVFLFVNLFLFIYLKMAVVVDNHSAGKRLVDRILCVLFNQGVHLIYLHKVEVLTYKAKLKPISELVGVLCKFYTSCHLSKKAIIDNTVIFPHPTGIVIGDGVVLMGKSIIYQNVTLGRNKLGYPKVVDSVIFPGSVVVGDIIIEDSVIGALTFCDYSVSCKVVKREND